MLSKDIERSALFEQEWPRGNVQSITFPTGHVDLDPYLFGMFGLSRWVVLWRAGS